MTRPGKPAQGWILVICYSMLGVCMPAAVTQFAMLVDTMADIMGVATQTILLADSLRAVCLVTGMFFSGMVYRRLGLRRTILLGLCFQILPQFLIPLALQVQSLPFFFVAKGMQGLNAVAFPLYLSTIVGWVGARYRGLATAIFNGSFTAGAGVGAWVSGKLIPAFGWQVSFHCVGLICLVFAVPALIVTKEPPIQTETPASTTTRPDGGYGRVMRMPATWLLVAAMLACTWVMQAVTVDMSIYAADSGFGYGQVGDLMLLVSVATVVFSIAGGSASDRAAARSRDSVKARGRTMVVGYVVTAVCAVLLPAAAASGFAALAVCTVAMMAGVSWAQGGFWAIPGDIYSPADNVTAMAICSSASNIVNPVAPMVVGVLLGTRGYWGAAWFTCAVISAVSVAATVLLMRTRRKNSDKGAAIRVAASKQEI